jgi:hypothetical protein
MGEVRMRYRKVLITGGSGLIGKTLVKHFLDQNWFVITTVSSEGSYKKLRDEFKNVANFAVIQSDLTIDGAGPRLAEKLQLQNLSPYAIINNARSLKFLKIEDNTSVTRENFISELTLDVVAPYEIVMHFALLESTPLRKVVNIGSMYGCVAANKQLYDDFTKQSPIHYSVAKAAVIQLTKELAVRLADRNIDVNCLSLGGIQGRVDEDFKKRYAKLCPAGRMLNLDDVSIHADYLVSPKTSGITGHNLIVDGGWTIW